MAKRAQIPRFGNWDKDDIPYSVYFDKARNERSGVRINPNNPEENCNEDGSSDLDCCSDKDSIQICVTPPPDKSSFPGKQQNGNNRGSGTAYALTRIHSDRLGLETPRVASLAGRDESAFNKTGSIKNFDRSPPSERKSPKFSSRGARTQQHLQRPSIPKSGSSTDNNVQCTASTKNACKDKAGYDAFWFPRGSPGNDRDVSPMKPPRLSPSSSRWSSSLSVHQHNSETNAEYYYKESSTRRRTSGRSGTLENGTNRPNPRYSSSLDSHHKITSDDRSGTLRRSSANSSSGRRNTESFRLSNMNQPYYSPFQRSPSAPDFTRCDETSAEGFSDTFNKAKEEKETELVDNRRPVPPLPVIPANTLSDQSRRKQGGLLSCLKASCCLFPEEKE